MNSIEGKKKLQGLQTLLSEKGIVADTIIEVLKEVRPVAIDEKDPSLTKVMRLTYEHLEQYGGFFIPIPEEEDEEEEGNYTPFEPIKEATEQVESLDYLIAVMQNAQSKINRVDLLEYRDMLMEYKG